MTPINIERSGDANLLTPNDDSHIGDILFFLLRKGMTWDKKTLSLTILCASPTFRCSPASHRGEHEKYRDSVSPINCEYHHTPVFYQIRVSQWA